MEVGQHAIEELERAEQAQDAGHEQEEARKVGRGEAGQGAVDVIDERGEVAALEAEAGEEPVLQAQPAQQPGPAHR